jgi:hypothetical protein
MLVSRAKRAASGEQAYRHILRDSVLSEDSEALRIVRRVGNGLRARPTNRSTAGNSA